MLGSLARAGETVVFVAPIRGEIDNGLAPFVKRAVREAEQAGASALVLPIDSLGGRVDSVIVIRDALLGAKIPTIAWVAPRAISAGALIALSAEHIVMTTGATIGAAAPVIASPEGRAAPAGEKATSFVRKEFRATAEARHRRPEPFEAMVDEDVQIPNIIEKGKLLTLTTEEALALGLADARAEDLSQVLAKYGLANAELRTLEPNWAEKLVRFATSPIVSSLLLGLGMLGLFIEIRTPGFGVPGIVGLLSLAVFFWSHALLALVGWEEIALIGLGLFLIVIEIFVVPGFGITGILGGIALVTGLGMSLVGSGVTMQGIVRAAAQIALSLAVAIVGVIALLRLLPRLPFGRRIILDTGLAPRELTFERSPIDAILPGDLGIAASPLHPSGVVEITGARIDALSEGQYIEAGAPIEVLRVERGYVVVRRSGELLKKG